LHELIKLHLSRDHTLSNQADMSLFDGRNAGFFGYP